MPVAILDPRCSRFTIALRTRPDNANSALSALHDGQLLKLVALRGRRHGEIYVTDFGREEVAAGLG